MNSRYNGQDAAEWTTLVGKAIDLEGISNDGLGYTVTISGPCSDQPRGGAGQMVKWPGLQSLSCRQKPELDENPPRCKEKGDRLSGSGSSKGLGDTVLRGMSKAKQALSPTSTSKGERDSSSSNPHAPIILPFTGDVEIRQSFHISNDHHPPVDFEKPHHHHHHTPSKSLTFFDDTPDNVPDFKTSALEFEKERAEYAEYSRHNDNDERHLRLVSPPSSLQPPSWPRRGSEKSEDSETLASSIHTLPPLPGSVRLARQMSREGRKQR